MLCPSLGPALPSEMFAKPHLGGKGGGPDSKYRNDLKSFSTSVHLYTTVVYFVALKKKAWAAQMYKCMRRIDLNVLHSNS